MSSSGRWFDPIPPHILNLNSLQMSQQLSFFTPVGCLAPPLPLLKSHQPPAKLQKLPAGFSAEENGEYFTVRYQDEWIGSIFHLGGKIWNLYFPNERGVCGFGTPDLKGAVAELYQCFIRREKGLEV